EKGRRGEVLRDGNWVWYKSGNVSREAASGQSALIMGPRAFAAPIFLSVKDGNQHAQRKQPDEVTPASQPGGEGSRVISLARQRLFCSAPRDGWRLCFGIHLSHLCTILHRYGQNKSR